MVNFRKIRLNDVEIMLVKGDFKKTRLYIAIIVEFFLKLLNFLNIRAKGSIEYIETGAGRMSG